MLSHIFGNCVIFIGSVFVFLSKTLLVFFLWLFVFFFLGSFFNRFCLDFYLFYLRLWFFFFWLIDNFNLDAIRKEGKKLIEVLNGNVNPFFLRGDIMAILTLNADIGH